MMQHVIDIQLATSEESPSQNSLVKWARYALIFLDSSATELTIRVVSSDEMQALNSQYRQKNKPTNVLSFPSELPADIEEPYLGDIVICAALVKQEAKVFLVDQQARWAHMVVHGVLHLLGFDHDGEEEALIMEHKESSIMQSLGFGDPYG